MAIDEVHLLNDNRGSTLEVCLTRTKIRAESRFVLVSATAPNVVDIANWIGARDGFRPAIVKQVRSLIPTPLKVTIALAVWRRVPTLQAQPYRLWLSSRQSQRVSIPRNIASEAFRPTSTTRSRETCTRLLLYP
jgi:superfamily II RNA helicase